MEKSGKSRRRPVIGFRTWIVGAVALTVTLAAAGVKPGAKPLPGDSPAAGQDPTVNPSISPRPPLPNPLSAKAPRIKQGNLIERVVADDLTPEQFQEVLVTVELKAGIDASKAVILIAGKPGNPRIVRFFQHGEDRIQVFVEAGGKFDRRDVKVRVGKATQLRTTALLDVKPYAFRPNTVEFKVARVPRAAKPRFTWAFGDGQSATTQVPWTTHSYPASAEMKTYQASVSFDPNDAGGGGASAVAPQEGGRTPTVRPRGTSRFVTLRETVVRWPRPAGERLRRAGEAIEDAISGGRERGPYGVSPFGRGRSRPKQTKLRDYAVGYEVYQAMKVLRKQQVTIEDVYRLKQEGKIRPWVPRSRTRAQAGGPAGGVILASYGGPQEDEDLDRLAEELYGPGYEFQYVPGRLVNARKGDLYLIERVDVPGVSAIIHAMGQVHTHDGILAEDQYTVRDMSADGKSPHPRQAGKLFRGSETDFLDPLEKIPYRLNPILLRQQGPGIRERSVDEAIVGGSLLLDTMILVKPLPANEAEDRPRVEAVVEAARQIESSVGLPGLYTNYYKLYAFTDARQIGMCSGYIWIACGSRPEMPLFDYGPELRRTLAHVCYDDTKEYIFRKAWEDASEGDVAAFLDALGFLDAFASNAANQIVNTFGWDDSYSLSHDWADFTDEQFGWSHTVSPDNMRPRWFDVQTGRDVDGWGRPWGYEVPLEYELGSYRAVRRDGRDSEGPPAAGPTTASRFKLVLHKLKCRETEEVTDEVYLKISFKNSAGRTVQSFTTKIYENLKDGDEETFNERDRENVGWIDIGEGVTVDVTLWEHDAWDSPEDKLGSKDFTIRPIPIPAGSAVVFGEPPGRKQDDPGSWTFERKDPNPFASDWKYEVWFQTVYAPAR